MKRNKVLYICLLLCCFSSLSWAQQTEEQLTLFTDKSCYLTGERIHVSTRCNSNSCVAYLELSDGEGMVAQTMAYLSQGKGWADMALPLNLHSGNYLLTAYTRSQRNIGESAYFQTIISIVNPVSVTSNDDVVFLQPEQSLNLNRREYNKEQVVKVSLPKDSAMTIHTLSVVRGNLLTGEYHYHGSHPADGKAYTPEIEGHIVSARPLGEDKVNQTRIVLVGYEQDVFDGQPQQDGSYLYYTRGIHDPQALLINGYKEDYTPAPMTFVSPYAQVQAENLPALQVWCTKKQLLSRARDARNEYVMTDWLKSDTLKYSRSFLANTPDYHYDMDEYVRMNTVREALIEFVKGVKRRSVHGTHQLYTMLEEGTGYSDWPALVLLDGVPVYDIDDILDYDARLLKYIQVYKGTFTFGSSICRGVISCITKKGLLSNYKLDKGSALVTYDFPQDHPHSVMPTNTSISTVYWNPDVDSDTVEFPAPLHPGIYQVVLQGTDRHGDYFQSVSEIKVN